MSDSILKERSTVDYQIKKLPFGSVHENIELFDASSVRLLFSDRKSPVDIGCIAYLVRKKKRLKKPVVLVDISSLKKERIERIANWLESVHVALVTGKCREATLFGVAGRLYRFMEWCDNNGHENVLTSLNSARESLRSFCMELEHRVRSNQLTISTATYDQRDAITSLSWLFSVPEDEISVGLRKFIYSANTINFTVSPENKDVEKVLSLCSSLFDGLTDFLLEEKTYPYKLSLPQENVWIFPALKWCCTKERLKDRDNWIRGHKAWDYMSGRMYETDEIIHHYANQVRRPIDAARATIRKASRNLEQANSDARNITRLKLATWAHDAFVVLFFANTGMNYSSVQSLRWSDDFTVGREFQGFKSIKYRAKGRNVEFHIASKFLPTFNRYLKLRSYLINNKRHSFLFAALDADSDKVAKIQNGVISAFARKIRIALYSEMPSISSRQWRVHKSNFILKGGNVSTAALVLQNEEATIIRSYMHGSKSESKKEFEQFYNKLSETIQSEKKRSHRGIAVGHCGKFNSPRQDCESPTVMPDCTQPEGCLFCTRYVVHADKKDIRKLLSLLFIIEEAEHLSASVEHYQTIFGEVVKRINAILNEISGYSKKYKTLISDLRIDVYEHENFDPYWDKKMGMLCEIGVM